MLGATLGERRRGWSLAVVAVALGLAWALKAFYSRAGFDELRWVLDPTVRLVEVLGGGPFELEAHHGWLSRAHRFEVVPACAGLNFLIAAFLSLACGLARTCAGLRHGTTLVLAGALAAYAATLCANATRIVIAMRLHEGGWSWGPLTPDRVHRIEGVVVYFLFLALLFTAGARVSGADRERTA